MKSQHRFNLYDILSIEIILIVTIFSFIRFKYLPQFLDDYYHLACAKGFLASGGWIGIDWWGAAPYGRPHLYPPFYHLLIALLKYFGIGGITILRICEVLIIPLFVFTLWYIFRKNLSSIFSFWVLVLLTSFFSFYSAITSNIPASLAILLGVFSWHLFRRRKFISSASLLSIIFYTHAGMCWVFWGSYVFLSFFNRIERRRSLLVALMALVVASPFLYHQLHYFKYVRLSVLREVMFSHFSIFIIVTGIVSVFLYFRRVLREKNMFVIFFLGYLLGSVVVFFKYPYRLFGAQGILGLIFLSALLLEEAIVKIADFSWRKIITVLIFIYLFFMHSTVDMENKRIEFHLFNSTYYNIVSGNFIKMLEFNSLYYPQYYLPVVRVIEKYTFPYSIVASNNKVVAQILCALTGRPVTTSLFVEVLPFRKVSGYKFARMIFWIRPQDRTLEYLKESLGLVKVYENDLGYVYLSPHYNFRIAPPKAWVSFSIIVIISLFFVFIFIVDNVKILTKRNSLEGD